MKRWNFLAFGLAALGCGFLLGCQSKAVPYQSIETLLQNKDAPMVRESDIPADRVVLVHGMWRDASAMRALENYLSRKGYQVLNISYPSTQYPIEELSRRFLAPVLEQQPRHPGQKLHFVTHSLGGILVRYYLKHQQPENMGRVVMLGPPNQGTEWADLLQNFDFYERWTGPSGQQLVTENNRLTQSLGPVTFELGVIAGNESSNFLASWILPGPDDGVISVARTQVTGMQDFLVVPEKHYNLKRNDWVLQQVVYFLQNGQFAREVSAQIH